MEKSSGSPIRRTRHRAKEHPISPELGSRLKAARRSKQLSLRGLAAELGVSAALLSQIELGHTQPSVSTLYALVNHLGLSLDELLGLQPGHSLSARFDALTSSAVASTAVANTAGSLALALPAVTDAAPSSPIIRSAGEHPTIQIGNGVTWELVATVFGSESEAVLATYQPGASSSADGSLMKHPGHDDAFLIEGELVLDLEGVRHIIRSGDSFSFESERPHRYDNVGTVSARGIWVKERGEV